VDRIELAHWRDADEIFARLLELPESERAAALAALSVNADVRALVVRLLDAHVREGVLDQVGHLAPRSCLTGRRFGLWTLDDEIGRGGMAVVYRGHTGDSTQPRIAAIKLLTASALVVTGAERFLQEQRILARLNHPHIAPLLDAGLADDGTPWLATTLVDGERIDTWCRARDSSLRDMVQLFLAVCEAVAYAHQNLVVHRDLKPSNVLVDVSGHVHLLDFGIARVLEEAGESTATYLRVLTPDFAAPEQFSGAPPSTAMDIYGLGALLYCLLTGAPPRPRGPDDPSAITASRAASSTPALAPALRRHRSRLLRGDLDAILAQALAPEPARRYGSVGALAADLRRWRDGLPVEAQRPSLAYRARKFVSRHRVGVFASIVLMLTALTGVATTWWQARVAREHAQLAAATRDFLVKIFDGANPENASGKPADINTILARAGARAREELADTPALRGEIALVIGSIDTRLGDFKTARAQLAEAESIAEQGHSRSNLLGRVLSERGVLAIREGDPRGAFSWFDRSIAALATQPDAEAREALLYAHLERAFLHQTMGDIAAALIDIDRAADIDRDLAPANARRRGDILHHRAEALRLLGRYAEARDEFTHAIETVGKLSGGDHPYLMGLAGASEKIGKFAEAEAAYRQALALVAESYPDDSPQRVLPMQNLAQLLITLGRFEEAEQYLREALALSRKRLPPGSAQLAPILHNLAKLLMDLGRYTEAVPCIEEVLVIAEKQFGRNDFRVLISLASLARASNGSGDRIRAVSLIEEANRRIDAFIATGKMLPQLESILTSLGHTALYAGRPDDAAAMLRRAGEYAAKDAPPGNRSAVHRDALIARALLRKSDLASASAAATALQPAVYALPPDAVRERGESLLALAEIAAATGDTAALQRHLAEAQRLSSGARYPYFVQQELTALGTGTTAPTASPPADAR
jgi:eukaryotic-like serine/threonine-protein kinase